MNARMLHRLLLLLIPGLFFLASCAPEVTFFVTKPPKLDIRDVETISIGRFEDQLNRNIPYPPALRGRGFSGRTSLKPGIPTLVSNAKASDLFRGAIVAGISESGQYKILNTGSSDTGYTGVIPDPDKTAVLNARIRYCEHAIEGKEDIKYTLLAVRGGGTIVDQARAIAMKESVRSMAERSGKGFNVPTPYVEKLAALHVEIDMVRQGSGEKIIPTQVMSSYFVKKWGGDEATSHVPSALREVIVSEYQKDQTMFEVLKAQVSSVEQALMDPNEFLARGGKLETNSAVPLTTLDIQNRLAKQIVDRLLKNITSYTEETVLEVASGDTQAVQYIRGSAYELAINRLETIERSEEDSYNLALAYESIGEYRQAARYYLEALDEDPENETYRQSLQRVQR